MLTRGMLMSAVLRKSARVLVFTPVQLLRLLPLALLALLLILLPLKHNGLNPLIQHFVLHQPRIKLFPIRKIALHNPNRQVLRYHIQQLVVLVATEYQSMYILVRGQVTMENCFDLAECVLDVLRICPW